MAGHCDSKLTHFIKVTLTQTVCPSTVMEFGVHLGVFDVGSVVFSGKWQLYMALTFVPVQKAIMVPL